MQPLNLKTEIPVYEKNFPSKKKKKKNPKNPAPFKYVKTSIVLKIMEGLQKARKLARDKSILFKGFYIGNLLYIRH